MNQHREQGQCAIGIRTIGIRATGIRVMGIVLFGLGLTACSPVAQETANTADTEHEQVQHKANYQQQLQDAVTLRERWLGLTDGVIRNVRWLSDSEVVYFKSKPGGYAFYRQKLNEQEPRFAFDHEGVAQSIEQVSGKPTLAGRLPFDTFWYENDQAGIGFYREEQRWSCDLAPSVSCVEIHAESKRYKAWGVVRDLRLPYQSEQYLAPNNQWWVQAHGHNIEVVNPAGEIIFATQDGTADAFYDLDSVTWAPHGQAFVVMQVTPGTPRYIDRVVSSPQSDLHPHTIAQLYPKAGDKVDSDRPVIVTLSTQATDAQAGDAQPQVNQPQVTVTKIDNSLFPNPYQLRSLQWQDDSQGFRFVYVERGHQHNAYLHVDAATGQVTRLVDENATTFIDQWQAFEQSLQGTEANPDQGALWLSERDGWAHLYLYDQNGELVRQVTQGDWRVADVQHVDEANQWIWFSARGMEPELDPYFIHYYRIQFDGQGLVKLSSQPADYEVAYAPDMKHFVSTYSRVDLPNYTELYSIDDDGKISLVRTLSQGNQDALLAAGFKAPEPFVAKGRDGSTDIWGLIVKPHDFDPNKRYPVVENIYAGPHASFVPKSYWPFGYHSGGDKVIGMQALANLGFIVVQMDGMGTSNRSKAFHDVAWKNLADSGFPDRILWHQAAAKQFPWYSLDAGVGIYGASAGGQSTVAALELFNELYTVGVAYAGCYDNRMDKLSWNEQWLGYPVGEQYVQSSMVEQAHLLQGDLLIINGEQDSNVDPASTMQLVNALINADKSFDLLLVPNGEHTVGRSTGPIDYIQQKQFEFFVDHLQQLHFQSLKTQSSKGKE